MAKGILPTLGVLPVEGKVFDDKTVDLSQREHPLLGVLDGHVRQPDVRIWRLLKWKNNGSKRQQKAKK